MNSILQMLAGGERKSIGKANEVVKLVRNDKALFDEVFEGIFNEDPIISIRSADVVEKVSRKNPSLIQNKKEIIFKNLHKFELFESKMSIAQIIGYLILNKKELPLAVNHLFKWLNEEKNIFVKVNCMTGLTDIALKHPELKNEVIASINDQMVKGSAAIKARGRKELKRLMK